MNKPILIAVISVFTIFAKTEINDANLNKTSENAFNRNAAENIYLDGKIAERAGDSLSALKYYLSAWKLDPASNYLTTYSSNFALLEGKPAEAIYVISGGLPYAALTDDKLHKLSEIFIAYRHFQEALSAVRELDTLNLTDSLLFADLLSENQLYQEASKILGSTSSKDDSLIQLKRADLYRRANDGPNALKLFKSLNVQYPNDKSIYKGLGLTLLAFGSENEAMKILTNFLPSKSQAPDDQVTELVGRYHASKGNYAEAISLFKTLYKETDSDRDFYFGRPLAIFSFLHGQLADARKIMEKLLVKNSNDYELHFLLGSVYEALDEKEKALDSYGKSISINSSFEEPHRAKVLLYVRSGNADKAISESIDYTTKFSKSPESWALYGSLLSMERRYSEATEPLSKAITLYKTNVPASISFEYGMALERSGKSSEAEKEFLKLSNSNKIHPAAANYLGYMWAEQNRNLQKAKELIKKALDADPENGAYLDSYGWVLYRLHDYNQALIYLTKASSYINDDYVIYYHLGNVLEKLNRNSEALIQYKKAMQFENDITSTISEKISKLEMLIQKQKNQSSEN